MKFDKSFLRNQFLLQRKKKYFNAKKFNFKIIFNLIRQHFYKRKIIIAGYYPANYEVNIINFLKEASKKNFRITLPIITITRAAHIQSNISPTFITKLSAILVIGMCPNSSLRSNLSSAAKMLSDIKLFL